MIKISLIIIILSILNILLFGFVRVLLGLESDLSFNLLVQTLTYGAEHDLRASASAFLPFVIFVLLFFIAFLAQNITKLKNSKIYKKLDSIFLAFGSFWVGLFGFLCAIFAAINYYYFQTYQARISDAIFELQDDETAVILGFIWEQYPILRLLCFAILFSALFVFILRFVMKREFRFYGLLEDFCAKNILKGKVLGILGFALFCVGFVWALRGFDTFPKGSRFTYAFSNNILANDISANPLIATQWSFSERKENKAAAPARLSEGELLELQKLNKNGEIFSKSPQNAYLAQNKPDIIFILAESFGQNMLRAAQGENWQENLSQNAAKTDMLGELSPYFYSGLNLDSIDSIESKNLDSINSRENFTFLRFLSGANWTNLGIANTLLNYFHTFPNTNTQKLAFSPIEIYKNAGYEVIFMTNGNASWRNIAKVLNKQGIDEFYDSGSIIERYKEAANVGFGPNDSFLFKMMLEILAQKTQVKNRKPLFIYALSVGNHPPFHIPQNHDFGDFKETLKQELTGDREGVLQGYYFQSNELGKFTNTLFLEYPNIVFAFSGDHRVRDMRLKQNPLYDYGVPFFISLPSELAKNLNLAPREEILKRIGGHLDIMPTLISSTLSEAKYLQLGRNLLQKDSMKSSLIESSLIESNSIESGKAAIESNSIESGSIESNLIKSNKNAIESNKAAESNSIESSAKNSSAQCQIAIHKVDFYTFFTERGAFYEKLGGYSWGEKDKLNKEKINPNEQETACFEYYKRKIDLINRARTYGDLPGD